MNSDSCLPSPGRRETEDGRLCFFNNIIFFICCCIFLIHPEAAWAAKIGNLVDINLWDHFKRFFSFQDASVRDALMGTFFLGICCGLLGSFIVVRKMALMGDSLSHAVLPGVAAGFLWTLEKDPFLIFLGATIAGLLGASVVGWITGTTRLKNDTAIGIVLSVFFAIGICMVAMIQRLPTGNKSGIQSYLFGQAAAISQQDLWLMGIITCIVVICIILFYRSFLVISFDKTFAKSIGFRTTFIHQGMMLLLSFAVIVGLQAVGVVLISAMLVTPAASALMLTNRMKYMLPLAACFGVFAGMLGAFFSFLGTNLPTGPFMVLSASSIFAVAFCFAPNHGVVTRWLRHRSRQRRVEMENALKGIYQVLESDNFITEGVVIKSLAERRHIALNLILKHVVRLTHDGLATLNVEEQKVFLTPEGWTKACSVIRKHRLWELYLTEALNVSPDQVHEDAEEIEHIIGEETVRELETRLKFPNKDPHGRLIPSIRDMWYGNITNRIPGSPGLSEKKGPQYD